MGLGFSMGFFLGGEEREDSLFLSYRKSSSFYGTGRPHTCQPP